MATTPKGQVPSISPDSAKKVVKAQSKATPRKGEKKDDTPKKEDKHRPLKKSPAEEKSKKDPLIVEPVTAENLPDKLNHLKVKLQNIQTQLNESSLDEDNALFLQMQALGIDVSPLGIPALSPKGVALAEPEKGKEKNVPKSVSTPLFKEIRVSPTFSPYPTPVFGVPLKTLVTEGSPQHYFWRVCVHFLLSPEALTTEGVWRVPGSAEEIQYYKNCFNEGKEVNFKCSYFDAAGLFKQWIRDLPEPLIPPLFDAQVPFLIDEHKGEEDSKPLVNDLKELIEQLPKPNFAVVTLLGGLLAELAKHSEVNKMTFENIIRCILPTVGCVPALFFWMMKEPDLIFGGSLVPEKLE